MKKMLCSLLVAGLVCVLANPADAGGLIDKIRQSRSNCSGAQTVCCPVPVRTCAAPAPVCVAPTSCATPCATAAPYTAAPHATHTYSPAPYSSPVSAAPMTYSAPMAVSNPAPALMTHPTPSQPVVTPTPTPAAPSASNISWQQAWNSVTGYIRSKNISVCDLKGLDPQYANLINGLTANEKHSESNVTLCFPSQQTWNSKPAVAAEAISILTRIGVL